MKESNFNIFGLDPESILLLKQIKEQSLKGEVDLQTSEALKAIELASKVVGTIMSGNQIDPVFFKVLSEFNQKRFLDITGVKIEKKRVKKKKKIIKSDSL